VLSVARELTPDVDPELFESGLGKAIDSQYERGGSRKSCAEDHSVDSCESRDVRTEASYTEDTDKDDPAGLVLDRSSGNQNKEPHGQGEASEDAAESLRHFLEDQC
jgi:hypothetical protein